MLPIRTAFDTYRTGFWVLWRNLDVALTAVVLMALFDPSVLEASPTAQGGGGSVAIPIMVAVYAVQIFIPAFLIFALSATFLSEGRVRGFSAICDFEAPCLVAWRLFVIAVFAWIPMIVDFLFDGLLFGQAFDWLADELASAETGDGVAGSQELIFLYAQGAVFLVSLGVSVILLGLRIPEIIDNRDASGGPGSIRRGARQFWRMAANLGAGPGLFIVAFYTIWWTVVTSPYDEPSRGAGEPGAIAASIAHAAVFAFCVAMTAGVLSDAYRRALAQEGQSRAA